MATNDEPLVDDNKTMAVAAPEGSTVHYGTPLNELLGRVVVVDKVYHSIPGDNPTLCGKSFSRSVKSREMPYRRIIKLTDEWKPLDKGWIDEIGMVYVEVTNTNLEAEVGCIQCDQDGPVTRFTRIPPGESIRVSPQKGDVLFLRKAVGDTQNGVLDDQKRPSTRAIPEPSVMVWVFPV